MDKDGLPKYTPYDEQHGSVRRRRQQRRLIRLVFIAIATLTVYSYWTTPKAEVNLNSPPGYLSINRLHADQEHCARLHAVPKDTKGPRQINPRYNGARPTLIRNATVWTGEPAEGATLEQQRTGAAYSWIRADVLVADGLIRKVAANIAEHDLPEHCQVHDGSGRLLTAGIVDMHSHTGVNTLPDSSGGNDVNELSSDVTPYSRSLDAINPLDPQIQVIKSGGVTTSLILPGSGNNMGGEAFVIKHAVGQRDGRPEISAEDMLVEHNWRYMKMACGENPKRVYGRLGRDFGPFSRMGEAWYFRHAFEQAQKLVTAQDDWCEAAGTLGVENMKEYLPRELRWESLGALLRGQVLLNVHCYTVPDLEAFVRHTNEFNFSVRAFHHAHQTYLVPEILKRNYGGRAPAAALFADNMYYKTESYIGSEQAGKILYENGITPVYVSDNPVLNAQHVVFEAAKAFKNGLPYHVALAGVTSASAELLGLGERIGKVKEGFDGDLALWDSDPLSVGATPVQVWIDGAAQFEDPVKIKKPAATPVNSSSRPEPLAEGLDSHSTVAFANVSSIALPDREHILDVPGTVVVTNGEITCVGSCDEHLTSLAGNVHTITLRNGHVVPPAIAFGSYLGLEEIKAEEDTLDGPNGADAFSFAKDGLALDTKSLRAAYHHGVTRAITAPSFDGSGHRGVSVGFRVGAAHALEKNAVFTSAAALHYSLTLGAKQGTTPSMSSAVGKLRQKLKKALEASSSNKTTTPDLDAESAAFISVINGTLPLAITAHKADVIASVLAIKSELDARLSHPLKLIIIGAAEAHIVAHELAASNVSVVLAPAYPYAVSWDQRRSLTGAPLTNGTAVDVLVSAGVRLAFGTAEDWETRDLYLMAGIAAKNSGGKISQKDALALISSNVDEMLGLKKGSKEGGKDEFVVFDGNPLEIDSRLRAVADGRGKVDVWREA